MFLATRVRRFIKDNLVFTILLFITTTFAFVGGYALFLQAQRADSDVHLSRNWKAWFIIGCYSVLGLVSLALTGKRVRILALRLKRIPQKEDTAPSAVRQFIQDEYWRTAAIAYVSQPKGSRQQGWGAPGTPYEGINFRCAILDTVRVIDAQARVIAPRLPILRPHIRIIHHFRALAALFPAEGISHLRNYDSIVQLSRYADRAPTETEFERGLQAFQALLDILAEYSDAPDQNA